MRWLLTYADMLTLLFALFIVMYGISQVESCGKLRQLESDLKTRFNKEYDVKYIIPVLNERPVVDRIVRLIKPPDGPYAQTEDDLMLISQKLYDEMKKQNMSHLVQLHLTERGLVVSLLTDKLLFDKGDAELKLRNTLVLDRIARILNADDHEIRVEGHTCNLPLLPYSRFKNNWELSTIRAANVTEYLVRVNGLDPARLSIIGYGEFRPLFANDHEDNRMKNRRVDIILLRKKATPGGVGQSYRVAPIKAKGEQEHD